MTALAQPRELTFCAPEPRITEVGALELWPPPALKVVIKRRGVGFVIRLTGLSRLFPFYYWWYNHHLLLLRMAFGELMRDFALPMLQ